MLIGNNDTVMGAMRLEKVKADSTAHYWRDGGRWGLDVVWKNGEFRTIGPRDPYRWCPKNNAMMTTPDGTIMEHLDNLRIKETSFKEWKDDNGHYAPEEIDETGREMSRGETHFKNCVDGKCRKRACVVRRQYQEKIADLERQLKELRG